MLQQRSFSYKELFGETECAIFIFFRFLLFLEDQCYHGSLNSNLLGDKRAVVHGYPDNINCYNFKCILGQKMR